MIIWKETLDSLASCVLVFEKEQLTNTRAVQAYMLILHMLRTCYLHYIITSTKSNQQHLTKVTLGAHGHVTLWFPVHSIISEDLMTQYTCHILLYSSTIYSSPHRSIPTKRDILFLPRVAIV